MEVAEQHAFRAICARVIWYWSSGPRLSRNMGKGKVLELHLPRLGTFGPEFFNEGGVINGLGVADLLLVGHAVIKQS